jgi:hypothetical protein
MNTLRTQFVAAAVLTWMLSAIQAQVSTDKGGQTSAVAQQSPKVTNTVAMVSPVNITVSKSFKWQHEAEKKPAENGKPNRHSNKSATTVPKATAVHYEIGVSNVGVKALGDVKIKWAVLLHGDQVKEGQSTGNLGIGGALNVKTEFIPIEKESDVTGYVVEVVAGGQVIGTEQEPKGIKDRIESHKKSESKSTPKKKSAGQ